MIDLLIEFSAMHQEVHSSLGSNSVQMLDDELIDSSGEDSSSSTQEAKLSLSRAGSMSLDMPMSLDLGLPVPDDIIAAKFAITFPGSKDAAAESIKSFMKIIQVLEDVESRLSK